MLALSCVATLLLTAPFAPAVAPGTPGAEFLVSEPPAAVAMASPSPLVSPLALYSGGITGFSEPAEPRKPKKGKSPRTKPARNEHDGTLGPERARILLRSLTVPGWGQASLGHRGSARTFLVAELGVWSAFTAFRVQQMQRTESYLRTAQLEAGIDLKGRDDEFRRIVGAFASSEEYNLLVVARDAANLYLADENNRDLEGYRRYIAEHSLSGDLSWSWSSESAFRRYGGQRKFAQKAGLRANAALGFAIANRLLSALHAARLAGRAAAAGTPAPTGWHLDVSPGQEGTGSFRAGLTTRF